MPRPCTGPHAGTGVDDQLEPSHAAGEPYPASSYLGKRPSYGAYVRNAVDVTFLRTQLGWRAATAVGGLPDGRPAVVVEESRQIVFSELQAQRDASTGSTYDVGLRVGAEGTLVLLSPGVIARNVSCIHTRGDVST